VNLEALQQLENISQPVGKCPDFVQGGGGNTSIKMDDAYMAVKASGFRLDQVTKTEGYVIVDYQKIRKYFKEVDTTRDVNFEQESAAFMKSCVLQDKNPDNLRPSIETGFHSFLGKAVIHTHSVYANILCCAREGKELAGKIFKEGFHVLWVPYINPGFDLTIGLNQAIDKFREENGGSPNIIFMENHGVIVTGENDEECLALHERVNDKIKEYFSIDASYPEIRLQELSENSIKSMTGYLRDYIKDNKVGPEMFQDIILYPDQLVYLGSNVSFGGDGDAKVNIDRDMGVVTYNTNLKEAKTIDETFTAYVYVVDHIRRLGMTIQTMSEEAIAFILNMEGEKYRKALLKGKN
jgi:rhamnose utilization protein RhaD (predicted bifunctional aldolase and dehydrogenase)